MAYFCRGDLIIMKAILCGNCELNLFYTSQDGEDLILTCQKCGFIIRLTGVLAKGTTVSLTGEL